MNTLACLLLAACTPGADPVPVIDSRMPPMTSYNNSYGAQDWSGAAQESRPRFFTRLRNLFSRKPSGMDSQMNQTTSGYPYQMTGNGTMGNTIISTTPMPSSNTINTFTPSNMRSQPISIPSSNSGLQRMPSGQPTTNGQPF